MIALLDWLCIFAAGTCAGWQWGWKVGVVVACAIFVIGPQRSGK